MSQTLQTVLSKRRDNDGLTKGPFQGLDQEWALIDGFWVRFDPRIPWQLGACLSTHLEEFPDLRLRLNSSEFEPEKGHRFPLRKAHVYGARFRWEDVRSYNGGRELRALHGDYGSINQGLDFVARVYFRWNFPRDENIAVLQIEEFRDTPQTSSAAGTTKYLHSIVDLESRVFHHLDGAIKTYSAEQYAAAYGGLDVKADRAYEKVFRTDDQRPVGDEVWMKCVHSFFCHDKLIEEYFGTDQEEED